MVVWSIPITQMLIFFCNPFGQLRHLFFDLRLFLRILQIFLIRFINNLMEFRSHILWHRFFAWSNKIWRQDSCWLILTLLSVLHSKNRHLVITISPINHKSLIIITAFFLYQLHGFQKILSTWYRTFFFLLECWRPPEFGELSLEFSMLHFKIIKENKYKKPILKFIQCKFI